jgi:hypothetical protein
MTMQMNFEGLVTKRPVRVSAFWQRLAKTAPRYKEWALFEVSEEFAGLVRRGEFEVDLAREMLLEAAEAYGVVRYEGRKRCSETIENAFRRVLPRTVLQHGPWLPPNDPRGWRRPE